MNAIADSPARLALNETQARIRGLRRRGETAAEVPGTFVVNHGTGRTLRSPEWQAIFGLPAEAEGDWEDIWRRLHPDDRRPVFTAIMQGLEPDGPRSFSIEHRVVWPDRSVHWVHVTARTSFAVENGVCRPWRTVGTMIDITDRKRAEAELCAAADDPELVERQIAQIPRPTDDRGEVAGEPRFAAR